jgi:Spy/CpxP family protein refolding chaperone
MKKRIMTFLLTSAFTAGLLLAQGPSTPPTPPSGQNPPTLPNPATIAERQVNRFTRLLGLTDAQQQQATRIFTDAGTAAVGLFASIRTVREDLHAAVQHNDLGTIKLDAAKIGDLTNQLTVAEATAQASFYAILTPDQQTRLTQFEARRRGRFGPGFGPGPGGMGPGGMGPHGPR